MTTTPVRPRASAGWRFWSYLMVLWDEPRSADPPRRRWFDWLIPAVAIPTGITEAVLRPEVAWRQASMAILVVVSVATLFRRRQPLLVVLGTLSLLLGVTGASIVAGVEWEGLGTLIVVLVPIYALGRWASGREFELGVVAMVVFFVLVSIVDWTHLGDLIGGLLVFFFPAVLGIAIRYQQHNRVRALDDVRVREREALARELHDTVAHHVSAIAVQAQAGLAVAGRRPEAALEALAVVENEASRTLSEMRAMIGALREGDQADPTPQRRTADIALLATAANSDSRIGRDGPRPQVTVDLRGDLDDIHPSVGAALYRLAQESITNAFRHARRASRIEVRVVGGPDFVVLTVADDGDVSALGPVTEGYGLVGMTERAKLLGGALTAGPHPGRGWWVEATLPRVDGRSR